MPNNHAFRARTVGAHSIEYEADDGNLAASAGSMVTCCWLRAPIVGNRRCPIYITGNNLFMLYLSKYGGTDYRVYGPGYNYWLWEGGQTAIADGNWHFLMLEADYSGGAGNGIIRLSLDGDIVNEHTGLTWAAPTSFTTFWVGSDSVPTYCDFDLDGVGIAEGCSTEAERDALYANGAGKKVLEDSDLANGTWTFRAGFDENSATADYAAGTAAPKGGNFSFTNGFWFGDTTWETTPLGPDEMWWTTHGTRLYVPTLGSGNPHGYDDWSARKGAYSEDVAGPGAFRVTADANGDLAAWCNCFAPLTFPHQFHIRFQTNGLADGEYLTLALTAPDSRGAGQKRQWNLKVYSDKIRGLYDYDVTVDTEAWVELAVASWIVSTDGYQVGAHAVVNGRDEVVTSGSLADATPDLDPPALRFAGVGLTGTPYLEVASLAIHSHMPPATKKTSADTFPDEDHLLATSNASRQAVDLTATNPWTDKGAVWVKEAGTWNAGGMSFAATILDTENDQLQIWCGGVHNAWSPWESGQYAYNIGYGSLQLAAWPDISIGDDVGVVQGALVYREDTPYLYPHIPGVIDDHDGRRMMVATRYHLPDSVLYAGQCMGGVVLGELTANETFVISHDGLDALSPRLPPSCGEVQLNSGALVYNPDAARAWRYVMYGQAYGEPPWHTAGANMPIRRMWIAHGETLETLTMWPSNAALLPVWDAIEGVSPCPRSGDDLAMVGMSSGGSRWIYVFRGRSPIMFHPAEKVTIWKAGEDVQSATIIPDYGRGIWHMLYSEAGNSEIHYAYMRIDGFDWIGIDAGQTAADVTTVTIQKPTAGWGSLHVNVDADAAGQKLEVALIDPATGNEITGWGQAQCDDVAVDDTDKEVTWVGAQRKLSQRTDATLRLRFHLTRAASGDPTPRLYSYRVDEWPTVDRGRVTLPIAVEVEPEGIDVAVQLE